MSKYLRLIVCLVLMASIAASVASEAEVIIHKDSVEVVSQDDSTDLIYCFDSTDTDYYDDSPQIVINSDPGEIDPSISERAWFFLPNKETSLEFIGYDDHEISNVETYPVEDDWLYNLIEDIPDHQGVLHDLAQCMVLVSGIQRIFTGGIERYELQLMLDKYFDYDESMISEDEDSVTICFSDNVSITLQYEQENKKFLTQATITLRMVYDSEIWNNHMYITMEYPIDVYF